MKQAAACRQTCHPTDLHIGNGRPASLLLSLAVALISATVSAAVPIEVSHAEFTTGINLKVLKFVPDEPVDVYPRRTYFTNYSRTLVSSSPVSDYMKEYHYNSSEAYMPFLRATGEAQAAWLKVLAYSDEGGGVGGRANAYAISEMTFSPKTNAVASISMKADHWGLPTYSQGFASLIDLTLDHPLWYYGWGFPGGSFTDMILAGKDRPEPYLTYEFAAPLQLEYDANGRYLGYRGITTETPLDMAHDYRLVIYTQTANSDDQSRVLFQVSGLEIVPEPTTFTLLGFGLLALRICRRRPTATA